MIAGRFSMDCMATTYARSLRIGNILSNSLRAWGVSLFKPWAISGTGKPILMVHRPIGWAGNCALLGILLICVVETR